MNLKNLERIAPNALSAPPASRGHRHFTERLLNRRAFLEKSGLSLGVLAGSGLLGSTAPLATRPAAALNFGRVSATSATPSPIPGGLELLGPPGPLFHLFLPATGAEPSTITNFNGFVGWAAVGGTGTHTPAGEAPQHLPFESDMRFMIGEFIGADGRNHHGAFAFI